MNRFWFGKNHIVLYKSTLDIYNFRFFERKNNQILIQPCYIISVFSAFTERSDGDAQKKTREKPQWFDLWIFWKTYTYIGCCLIHCTPYPFDVIEKRKTCCGNCKIKCGTRIGCKGLFLKTCPLHLRKPLTHYALWFLVQSLFLI